MTRVRPPYLIEFVADLRRDLDARKTAQRMGGDSLFGNLTYSSNPNDWSSGAIAWHATQNYILTFTPASNPRPVVQLFFFYSIDQTDVKTNYVPVWANGPAITLVLQPLPPTANSMQWAFSLTNNDGVSTNHTAYVSLIFSGTDTGTWSIASR